MRQRLLSAAMLIGVALATALLATADLFVVSLVNLARTELGIQREGLVTFRLSPYLNGYSRERAQALFDRVEEDLEAVPGVVSVTTSTVPLLANSNWQNDIGRGIRGRTRRRHHCIACANGHGLFPDPRHSPPGRP